MFKFFSKKKHESKPPKVDIHSHLLPGIDDGAKTIEESLDLIKGFEELGYTKLITTPHIKQEYYPNNPDIIMQKLKEVQGAIRENGIDIELEVAAEYFLDEHFIQQVEEKKRLLTFGDNYLLFEIGFLSEPLKLKEVVFELVSQGYKPVLAHPERYNYYHHRIEALEDLIDRGVLLQLNLNSLTGFYSSVVNKFAEQLIKNDMIRFVGSDCHNSHYLEELKEVFNEQLFYKTISLPLLNDSL